MSDIDGYEDWPAFMDSHPLLTGDEWTTLAAGLMGVPQHDSPLPREVRAWTAPTPLGPISLTELAWPVGFGPENHGYLLHQPGTDPARSPGVMVLHSHGGVKSVGAYRDLPLADTDHSEQADLARVWRHDSDEPTLALRAAARGFAVFVPDAFSWGSRRFALDFNSPRLAGYARLFQAAGHDPRQLYDDVAGFHEHIVAKVSSDLGTSYPGMIALDDQVSLDAAVAVLGRTPAVIGHSGGGGRAINLSALRPELSQVGVVSMMTTLSGLLPDHSSSHSWLLHIPGLARVSDLPELAANRRTHHLAVIYGERDHLFTLAGMRAAHDRLTSLFEGQPGSYHGHFHSGGHEFSPENQDLLLDWLARRS